jgi:hypothetical protein
MEKRPYFLVRLRLTKPTPFVHGGEDKSPYDLAHPSKAFQQVLSPVRSGAPMGVRYAPRPTPLVGFAL